MADSDEFDESDRYSPPKQSFLQRFGRYAMAGLLVANAALLGIEGRKAFEQIKTQKEAAQRWSKSRDDFLIEYVKLKEAYANLPESVLAESTKNAYTKMQLANAALYHKRSEFSPAPSEAKTLLANARNAVKDDVLASRIQSIEDLLPDQIEEPASDTQYAPVRAKIDEVIGAAKVAEASYREKAQTIVQAKMSQVKWDLGECDTRMRDAITQTERQKWMAGGYGLGMLVFTAGALVFATQALIRKKD